MKRSLAVMTAVICMMACLLCPTAFAAVNNVSVRTVTPRGTATPTDITAPGDIDSEWRIDLRMDDPVFYYCEEQSVMRGQELCQWWNDAHLTIMVGDQQMSREMAEDMQWHAEFRDPYDIFHWRLFGSYGYYRGLEVEIWHGMRDCTDVPEEYDIPVTVTASLAGVEKSIDFTIRAVRLPALLGLGNIRTQYHMTVGDRLTLRPEFLPLGYEAIGPVRVEGGAWNGSIRIDPAEFKRPEYQGQFSDLDVCLYAQSWSENAELRLDAFAGDTMKIIHFAYIPVTYTPWLPDNATLIPQDVTVIEPETFMGTDVYWVVIPDGVTTIGSRAFANCTSLDTIVIPASVTSIAEDAFEGCGDIAISTVDGSAAKQYAWDHHIACIWH